MQNNFSYFKDLKIVEFASVLAGPSVGMFFAELGAKVIKVESPSGDMTRKWKLKSEKKKKKSWCVPTEGTRVFMTPAAFRGAALALGLVPAASHALCA